MSFIQAGNDAVNSALQISSALERNKPRYDKFGQQAIKDQTAQDLIAMQIRGRAQQAALETGASEKASDIYDDAHKYVEGRRRQTKMA